MSTEEGRGYNFDFGGDMALDTVTLTVDLPEDVTVAVNEFYGMISEKLNPHITFPVLERGFAPSTMGVYHRKKLQVIVDLTGFMELDKVEQEDYCVSAVESVLSFLQEEGGVIQELTREVDYSNFNEGWFLRVNVFILTLKDS